MRLSQQIWDASKKTASSDSSAKSDSVKKSTSTKKTATAKKPEAVRKSPAVAKTTDNKKNDTNKKKETIITRIFSDGLAGSTPEALNGERDGDNASNTRVPPANPNAEVGRRVGESNGNRTVRAREVRSSILDIIKQASVESEKKAESGRRLVSAATTEETVSATQVISNEQDFRNAERSNVNAEVDAVDARVVPVTDGGFDDSVEETLTH